MKQIAIYIAIFFSAASCAAQQHTISIKNPLAVERNSELIVLQRADINKKLPNASQFKITSGNEAIPYQLVDLNNDNNWDELVLLSSFKPNETKSFIISQTTSANNTIQPLAHVRMKLKNDDDSFGESITSATMPYQNPPTDFSKKRLPPYLTEGPGWENDKVAFRLYFDTRNTIDIYGKRIPGMVMDTVGANPAHSYHNLSGWGMDILHVVKSLGAGSLAIATKDENGKDTLIRLGGKNITKETYQQLADGPLFAAFEMDYEWQINNKPVTVKQQFHIWGGQYYYESKLTITGAPQGSKLVSGIADFYDNKADSFKLDNAAVLLSHGKQSENKDELGMAILVPAKSFAYFGEAPKTNSDVMETHLIAQNIKNNTPLSYRFYTCWQKTDINFASAEYFKNFMQTEAKKFSVPLQISWSH